jgi:N-acyl-D-amino-acid deacylase
VMGGAPRPAADDELTAMARLLDDALAAGAFGFSSGLIYAPGQWSTPAELDALAARLGGRVYASHVRNEGALLLTALDEAVNVGRRTGARVQISHLKAAGLPHWGQVPAALRRMDDARAAGVAVAHDVYPYTASSTMLRACLPPWAQAGDAAAVLERLRDPAARARIARDVASGLPGWENMTAGAGYDRIVVAATADHRFEGETLAAIAARLGTDGCDALCTVLLEEALKVSIVLHSMGDEDVEAALSHPWGMIGSDGLPAGGGGRPHPRLFGTFPRVLSRYVRERPVLTLEEAVHRMTGLPAAYFGMPDRGVVEAGRVADLVVFDPAAIRDVATFDAPEAAPAGIAAVYQEGRQVVEGARYRGPRRGRVLRAR